MCDWHELADIIPQFQPSARLCRRPGKILALLSSGEGAMEPKQFGTAKELFYALAEALKTAQTILLLVEPDRYLRTKEQLLRAMGLSTVPNPELMEALQKALYSSRKKIFRAMPPSRWAQLRSRRRMACLRALC